MHAAYAQGSAAPAKVSLPPHPQRLVRCCLSSFVYASLAHSVSCVLLRQLRPKGTRDVSQIHTELESKHHKGGLQDKLKTENQATKLKAWASLGSLTQPNVTYMGGGVALGVLGRDESAPCILCHD